jgi:cell division protein FtsN
MNDLLKRRLLGLAVVLGLLFALTWLLPPGVPGGAPGTPSTTVSLNGSALAPPGPPAATAASPVVAPAETPPPADAATGPEPWASSAAPVRGAAPTAAETGAAAATTEGRAPASTPEPEPADSKLPAEVSAMPGQDVPPPAPRPAPPPSAGKLVTSAPPPAEDAEPQPMAASARPPAVAAKPPVAATVSPVKSLPPAPPRLVLPSAPPPKPAMAGRTWFVQVGSFAEEGRAQTTLSLLQNIGYHGVSDRIDTHSGGTLYRVRVGPFLAEADARAAFDKVSHQGYPQARVVWVGAN